MDLRQFRYFVAVAEVGSFAEASRSLHIAQPALSRQIGALEDELGCVLFYRLPRGVALTRAGQELLEQARHLLAQFGQIKPRVAAAAAGGAGRLTLGVLPGYSCLDVVSAAIRSLRQASPAVEVMIETALSADLLAGTKEGQLDACVAAWRPPLDSTLAGEVLYRDLMVLAMPTAVAQANPHVQRLSELSQQSFLMFPRAKAPSHFDLLKRAFDDAGIAINGPMAADLPTLLGMVSAGLGCGVVPASYRSQCPATVVLRQLDDLNVIMDLEIVYRAHNHDPLLTAFLSHLRASMDIAR